MRRCQSCGFQSTHPSGVRRLLTFPCQYPSVNFNPRTPVGCDASIPFMLLIFMIFQSTHPSGVRRQLRGRAGHRQQISIHAPQWGATSSPPDTCDCRRISIHAPQWGATPRLRPMRSFRRYFNPRTPVGCDPFGTGSPGRQSVFQSTHPSGVRLLRRSFDDGVPVFQSTHPSGVRQPILRLLRPPQDFNPRTPVGCNQEQQKLHAPTGGFQSTHPSGVRQGQQQRMAAAFEFQSTHPSGVRRYTAAHGRGTRQYFNPRTPVGCDMVCSINAPPAWISIHAPQWGATCPADGATSAGLISIHAPQWGATGRHQGLRLHAAISIHAPQWGATHHERTSLR